MSLIMFVADGDTWECQRVCDIDILLYDTVYRDPITVTVDYDQDLVKSGKSLTLTYDVSGGCGEYDWERSFYDVCHYFPSS